MSECTSAFVEKERANQSENYLSLFGTMNITMILSGKCQIQFANGSAQQRVNK